MLLADFKLFYCLTGIILLLLGFVVATIVLKANMVRMGSFLASTLPHLAQVVGLGICIVDLWWRTGLFDL